MTAPASAQPTLGDAIPAIIVFSIYGVLVRIITSEVMNIEWYGSSTLVCNLLGCVLMGVLVALEGHHNARTEAHHLQQAEEAEQQAKLQAERVRGPGGAGNNAGDEDGVEDADEKDVPVLKRRSSSTNYSPNKSSTVSAATNDPSGDDDARGAADSDSAEIPPRLSVYAVPHSHEWWSTTIAIIALKTGFCGSLTTYSTWNLDVLVFLRGRGEDVVLRGILATVLGMLVGCALCYVLSRWAVGRFCSSRAQKCMLKLVARLGRPFDFYREKHRLALGAAAGPAARGEGSEEASKASEKEDFPQRGNENSASSESESGMGPLVRRKSEDKTANHPKCTSHALALAVHAIAVAGLVAATLACKGLLVPKSSSADDLRPRPADKTPPRGLSIMAVVVAAFVGGPVGANGRFFATHIAGAVSKHKELGTFGCNLVACCALIGLYRWKQTAGSSGYEAQILFLIVGTGVCGALSTMSSFMADVFGVAKHRIAYGVGTLVFCAGAGEILLRLA